MTVEAILEFLKSEKERLKQLKISYVMENKKTTHIDTKLDYIDYLIYKISCNFDEE